MNRFFTKFPPTVFLIFIYHLSVYGQTPCDSVKVPTIATSKTISCAGQAVVLKATGCDGDVIWNNKKKGATITVSPTKTTTYWAICEKNGCKSKSSNSLVVEIYTPTIPTITATKTTLCFGETTTLTASGCKGETIWSNNQVGNQITVTPINTTKYTATCRHDGCVSCFAEEIKITVKGGPPLALTSNRTAVCAGEQVTLTATGICEGSIRWSDGQVGNSITTTPKGLTVYTAQCVAEGCQPTMAYTEVNVAPPFAPTLSSDKSVVCKGESITLNATGCTDGTIVWSNGMKGKNITLQPTQSGSYTAICQRGSCESQSSTPISFSVSTTTIPAPKAVAEVSNKCPFMTVDLSSTISTRIEGLIYEAHTTDSPASSLVNNVGAITDSKTYYLFAKDAIGCYSMATPVKVSIQPCSGAIFPCISNPATASISRITPTPNGTFIIEGQWGGSAKEATWSSNGTGGFSALKTTSTIYTPSAEDKKSGKIIIELRSDDPDGAGPCHLAVTTQEINILADIIKPKEMIGLTKTLANVKNLGNSQFEITYDFGIQNMGSNELRNINLLDSLDKTFKNGAIVVGNPSIKVYQPDGAISTNMADTTYKGGNGRYSLLKPSQIVLGANKSIKVSMSVKIDISQAKDTVFYNTASVSATDINGSNCIDQSTDAAQADTNRNGDANDDSTPTVVVLNAHSVEIVGDIFIPEGFSPNGDGINDTFFIRKPTSVVVNLEIYNRSGGLVYRNEDYKNDWAGMSSTKNHVPSGTYFYVVRLNDGREFSRFLTISR